MVYVIKDDNTPSICVNCGMFFIKESGERFGSLIINEEERGESLCNDCRRRITRKIR